MAAHDFKLFSVANNLAFANLRGDSDFELLKREVEELINGGKN